MMMMIIISINWIYNPFIISIHDDDDDAMDNSCSDRLCMKTTSKSTPIQWKPPIQTVSVATRICSDDG